MANQEHLDILAKGVKAWNEWIRPEVMPIDLRGANLAGWDLNHVRLISAHLDGANFEATKLGDADLRSASLSNANLRGTNLNGSMMTYAKLRRADLSDAELFLTNLSNGDLSEAKLNNAGLIRTNLDMANLQRADFTAARLNGAILTRCNMAEAIGLESCLHVGPVAIDFYTCAVSGQLPTRFLRGCGLPDVVINYLPSLAVQAVRFYSCFISYSTKDQEFAERLRADLQARGVPCWFAHEDLKIGDRFRTRIDESIWFHDKLLLVLSRDSIVSPWVEKEVETAFERERREKREVLFPIRLDDAVMETTEAWAADIRRARHIGDFTGWKDSYQKAFDRLVRDLKAEGKDTPGKLGPDVF